LSHGRDQRAAMKRPACQTFRTYLSSNLLPAVKLPAGLKAILVKTLGVSLCYVCLCSVLCGQTQSKTKNGGLIFEHVAVIDSTGSPLRLDVSVLIVGDRIKSLSLASPTKPAPGAIVVDAKGKFLVAGLWDMHVHALNKNVPEHFFPLFIANGVTGIRDMGGDIPLAQIAELKKEIADGSRFGPQIFAAGPILEGEHPFWPFSIAVKSPGDARRAVGTLVGEGADFLKVYNTLSRDSYLAIASQAKEMRVPFVGHIPDSVTPAEASRFGQKSIEHLWGIPNYLSAEYEQLQKMASVANDTEDPNVARDLFYKINETILATYDPKKAQGLYEEFARNGTWQAPTLVVLRSYASIHDPALRKDPRISYISDDLLGFWKSMGGQPDPRNDEIQMHLFQHDLEIVRAMHAANVPLLAGTDTPNPYSYPGFSLHEELELLVSAGLSPLEALQAATLRAAEFLGVERLYGSVEEGKIANLVLLDANPLEDIRNTQKIRGVVLRGKFLDRTMLDKMLADQRLSHSLQ